MEPKYCQACGHTLTTKDIRENRRWCRRNICVQNRRHQNEKMVSDREALKPLDRLVASRKAMGSAWWWR